MTKVVVNRCETVDFCSDLQHKLSTYRLQRKFSFVPQCYSIKNYSEELQKFHPLCGK